MILCWPGSSKEAWIWNKANTLSRQHVYLHMLVWKFAVNIGIIAPDKAFFFSAEKFWYFSYFSLKTGSVCFWYSLEVLHQGTSTEYPQHMFSWRNKRKERSQCMIKPLMRLMWAGKTQISLHICIVWSESSLIATCLLQPLGYPKRNKWEPLRYWMDVKDDLNLHWSHRTYCRFCRALAQILCGYCLLSGAMFHASSCIRLLKFIFVCKQSAFTFRKHTYSDILKI